MKFLRISWESAARMAEKLAGMVDYKPDMLVGISRGGLVPVRILSDKLGIRDVGILGIGFYAAIGRSMKFPRITQGLSKDVEGKRILVVDDVSDTGKSLFVAREYLRRHGAAQVKIATLHYKPSSEVRPDYFIGETSAWIVYPWERHEVKRELAEKRGKK